MGQLITGLSLPLPTAMVFKLSGLQGGGQRNLLFLGSGETNLTQNFNT